MAGRGSPIFAARLVHRSPTEVEAHLRRALQWRVRHSQGICRTRKTPIVPGLDLPGLDVVSAAEGFGCASVWAKTKREIKQAFSDSLEGRSYLNRNSHRSPRAAIGRARYRLVLSPGLGRRSSLEVQ
jgi:hypothetical protein